MDQVGTKYTISQNGTYVEFCVQYLFSVSCTILPMKLFIDGKNFTYLHSFSRSLVMMQQMGKMWSNFVWLLGPFPLAQ